MIAAQRISASAYSTCNTSPSRGGSMAAGASCPNASQCGGTTTSGKEHPGKSGSWGGGGAGENLLHPLPSRRHRWLGQGRRVITPNARACGWWSDHRRLARCQSIKPQQQVARFVGPMAHSLPGPGVALGQ